MNVAVPRGCERCYDANHDGAINVADELQLSCPDKRVDRSETE